MWGFTAAVETYLVDPYFPLVVKSERLCPDSDHAPAIKQDDAYSDRIEHCLGGDLVAFLDGPKCEDSSSLGCYAHEQEIRQLECVVGYDFVL